MKLHLLVALGTLLAAALPVRGAEGQDAPAPHMPRVTASFTGSDLIETLYYLFRGTGLRYEAPRGTRETFTAELEDVPLEKALRVVLEPKGFTFRREGDLYRIEREGAYRPVGERLDEETQARQRRWEAEFVKHPPVKEPRRRVRFLYDTGVVQSIERPVVGVAPGTYLNAFGPPPQAYPRVPAPPTRPVNRQRTTQPLSLGPITLPVPLPPGLRFLGGGGIEYSIPAEGETKITGPMGTYTIPFTAPGLTIQRR